VNIARLVAAVANEHRLFGACDVITPESTLHDQLGMDEADIIEVIIRAEDRFGINLPDDGIGFSSTLTDVVDLIAERLSEKQTSFSRVHTAGELPLLESPCISAEVPNASSTFASDQLRAQAESTVHFVPD